MELDQDKPLPAGILLGRPFGSRAGKHEHDPLDKAERPKFRLDELNREISLGSLARYRGEQDLAYEGESHLITIAPTGSGKGVSGVIPNLLTYPGPVVVIDPKGENFAVTARRRREMGHQVVRLDPFEVLGPGSDSLNPLDLYDLSPEFDETDAEMLAELVSTENKSAKEPFWDNSARGLIAGIINCIVSPAMSLPKNVASILDKLYAGDVVYGLATLLDEVDKEKVPKAAYQEIAVFLQMVDVTRGGVLAVAQSYFKCLASKRVSRALGTSTLSLRAFVEGEKISIFLIIPPHKLASHRSLLRLWIGTLLHSVTNRRRRPPYRTLFVLDECAQLGYMSHLESIITLCRGYGVNAWMFWQDLSQLQKLYDVNWRTMLNNCEVVQMYGAKNHLVAKQFAAVTGTTVKKIRDLRPNEQVLMIRGRRPVKAARFHYLRDSRFDGWYDPNPLYTKSI